MIRAHEKDKLKVSLSQPCEIYDGVTAWEWKSSFLDKGAEALVVFRFRTLANPVEICYLTVCLFWMNLKNFILIKLILCLYLFSLNFG